MSGRLWRLVLTAAALFSILFSNMRGASAQSAFTATLSTPDTSAFPHLTAFLDVHDPAGKFVHGLSMQDILVNENDTQEQVSGLTEKKPGVQFVMAITPGSSFGIRDTTGVSRYEYLLQSLLSGKWAENSADGDDFSLLTVGGPQLLHTSDLTEFHSSLESYQPSSSENTSPDLEVLASALQVASDPTPRQGMERVILFITPPQGTEVSLGLQSIMASANQQNIHIFVWLVAPIESFNLAEIDQLRDLAAQTHGAFFAFSHDEPVPDLDSMLESFRYVYQLGYESQIAKPGAQQVAALVTIGSEQVTSNTQAFELDLQPPALVVLDPPTEITRKFAPQPTPEVPSAESDLLPVEQQLTIQVTFPDGFDRPITHTGLFVDGKMIAENLSSPFDQFSWDLRPYTQDGTHTLWFEATDKLGITGQTNPITINITVPSTAQEVVAVVSQKRLLVVGITIFISASILVLVLILGGRIHPRPYPGLFKASVSATEKTRPAGYRERIRQLKDPVTQPVKIGPTLPAKTRLFSRSWMQQLPWRKRKETPITDLAYLVPLVGSDEPTLPAPLHITTDIVTLGSDPQKANLVIADASIEALHAKIDHTEMTFLITDLGSAAGTWVNYEQVTPEGTNLEHADIVHLGRVGFRFNLRNPGAPRKVVVAPLEINQ